ncbi:MAG: hypothetical protein IKA81_06645 [Alistipes sp.]|nr:hypothetical protein [Alistipes sp.]
MVALIIWIIGLVLTIKAAIEILNLEGDTVKKLLSVIVLILSSWLGLLLYYFWAREKVAEWVR